MNHVEWVMLDDGDSVRWELVDETYWKKQYFYRIEEDGLSGDEMTLREMRVLRDGVIRYNEEKMYNEGIEVSEKWLWLEDRLEDACRYGEIESFRLHREEWDMIESM